MTDIVTSADGWAAVLDMIRVRLEEAFAAADARATSHAPAAIEPGAAGRRNELDQLVARMAALPPTPPEADAADQVLAAAEEFLHWRLAETESLRQRLAAWAARAIG